MAIFCLEQPSVVGVYVLVIDRILGTRAQGIELPHYAHTGLVYDGCVCNIYHVCPRGIVAQLLFVSGYRLGGGNPVYDTFCAFQKPLG